MWIQSPGFNSGQKPTLETVIRKKKNHRACNSQNHQNIKTVIHN